VDHLTVYDEKTSFEPSIPFLKPITDQQRLKLAEKLLHDDYTSRLLRHLEKLQGKMDFVGLKFFDKHITNELNDENMREALTKARKLKLITTKTTPNPRDKNNPTTAIEVNKNNPITKKILSRKETSSENLWELLSNELDDKKDS
jgi:hypothetical protein